MRNYLPNPPPTEIGTGIPPYQLKPYKKMTQEQFIELMKKPSEKIHKANFAKVKSGWVSCTKPDNTEYGLIINSLVDDIANGSKEFVSYDEKKQILSFKYGKNNSNPFK